MAKKPKKPIWIIGIDEVGRGPLAGPVYVCAVAMRLTEYRKIRWVLEGVSLTDSKKMSPQGREVWEKKARDLEKEGKLKIAVSSRGARAIDDRGIAPCIRACIASALRRLSLAGNECTIFLDGGLKAPGTYRIQQTVIRGDLVHKIISLAAVIAKVRRDNLMKKLHRQHPRYDWEQNKGYGTAFHLRALRHYGPSPIHRKSFISKVF